MNRKSPIAAYKNIIKINYRFIKNNQSHYNQVMRLVFPCKNNAKHVILITHN